MRKCYFLMFMLALLWGCDFNRDVVPITTELLVRVTDDNANPQQLRVIPNATVVLYRSRLDFEARVNPIASATADAEGIAAFSNLEAVEYYVYAFYVSGGQVFDNSTSNFRIGEVLVENALSIVQVRTKQKRPLNPTKITVQEIWVMDFPTIDTNATNPTVIESKALIFNVGRIPKGTSNWVLVNATLQPFVFLESTTFGASFLSDDLRRVRIANPSAVDLTSNDVLSLRTLDGLIRLDEGNYNLNGLNLNNNPLLPDRIRISEKPDSGIVLDIVVRWN